MSSISLEKRAYPRFLVALFIKIKLLIMRVVHDPKPTAGPTWAFGNSEEPIAGGAT